jgi:hypothetical protein
MNMPVETFLTALYTYVDDWYQTAGRRLLAGKVGKKPEFADSEVLTLMLAQHWCGFRHESAWLRHVRQNYHPLFPRLLSQSEFNRRARNLCWLLNRLRLWVVQQLEAFTAAYRLTDGTPIHVRHWRRYGLGHLQLREAALGYCASKRETFYGYRLVVLTTLDGIITDWALVSAGVPPGRDEREAVLDLLTEYRNLTVLGDKGFLDRFRQSLLTELSGNRLFTPKRKNQKEQNAPEWDAAMNRARRMIETTFGQAKEFFGLEQPRARSWWGVLSRIIAKLTGLTIAASINKQHDRSPLTLATFSF